MVFYAWWDWRFVSPFAISTLTDYHRALARTTMPTVRTRLVALSLAVKLGILSFFKYVGFFAGSFATAMATVGWQVDLLTDVVLPVGISFYTFQTLSYTLDVYRKKLEPTNDLPNSPCLPFFPSPWPVPSSGRAASATSRPTAHHHARSLGSGLVLVTWGLFKKMVLADNAALTDPVFDNPAEHAGLDPRLGALAFTLQIYVDFSGYTDIARGLASGWDRRW